MSNEKFLENPKIKKLMDQLTQVETSMSKCQRDMNELDSSLQTEQADYSDLKTTFDQKLEEKAVSIRKLRGQTSEIKMQMNQARIYRDQITNTMQQLATELSIAEKMKVVEEKWAKLLEESEFYWKEAIRPFQWVGARFMAGTVDDDVFGVLLADQMGLGKTLEAVASLDLIQEPIESDELSDFAVLWVCPNSIKSSTVREIEKWSPGRPVVKLEGPADMRKSLVRLAHQQGMTLIVNYEALRTTPTLMEYYWPIVILDEAHKFKNDKTITFECVKKICLNAGRVFPMTGTPIMNRPDELWAILHILTLKGKYQGKFARKWQFTNEYCTPAWAEVWMGDLSFRKIGDVEIGEEVIGWQIRDSGRRELCKATVFERETRVTDIVKITLESGNVVYSTPDHKWRTPNRGTWGETFAEPKIGRYLCKVIEPTRGHFNPHLLENVWAAGYVAGLYDGEGSAIQLAQSEKNYEVIEQYCKCLEILGIRYYMSEADSNGMITVTLLDGRQGVVDFLNRAGPVRRRGLIERFFKMSAKPFVEHDKIVKIEPYGEALVVALTTSTGNYVSQGYASKNCYTYGYQGSQSAFYPGAFDRLVKNIKDLVLRRRKDEVEIELPDKVREVRYVELGEAQRALYDQMKSKLYIWLDEQNKDYISATNVLAHLTRLRQLALYPGGMRIERADGTVMQVDLTDSAKVDEAMEVITELLENGEKCLVFCNYNDALHEIKRRVEALEFEAPDGEYAGKAECGLIIGGIPEWQRAITQENFNDSKSALRIVCGNTKAMGLGLNLQGACSHAIFLDLDWTPGANEQAEDRLHRDGQKNAVTIHVIQAENTVDAFIAAKLDAKVAIISGIIERDELRRALDSGLI